MSRRRVRARVEGVVQGVGFRPYVYRLAGKLGLAGFVRNDPGGVVLEVEVAAAAVDRILARLAPETPALASVDRIVPEEVPATGAVAPFAIAASDARGQPTAMVSPDVATCAACLVDLFDPRDRRHRYPFINCTDCGPRFTIVLGIPYDRPLTTMAGFTMCPACRAEYDDPADRRFHAQPNACPACGPRVRLIDREGRPATLGAGPDAVAAAAAALATGSILAIKGIGGYHLACRADDGQAVTRLRARKRREEKPFALMAPDLEAARGIVRLGPEDEEALSGRERPIVLARRRSEAAVAAAVAPDSADLGVMLPYSPLHHILAADAGTPLVMTSGNLSDEPIAHEDADALERLAAVADLLLVHDLPIATRTDDSVLRARRGGRPLLMRRSRGYLPASLPLPLASARPLLACGAELKSTFCLARGRLAWVGHHIGDLRTYERLRSFREGIAHFERLFLVEPEVVVHDLHPDYLSTAYALERDAAAHLGVQHHHAHLAACLAEHGEQGPAVGAIYDGTGHGLDGTAWGGEILIGGLGGFTRVGHLQPVAMPGGDAAVREPWRMACSWLRAALEEEPPLPPALAGRVAPERWTAIAGLARTSLASPLTTSVGPLFDAVAAICGLRPTVTYEGQAAIALEAAAAPGERGAYPLPVVEGAGAQGALLLDARPTVRAAAADGARGAGPPLVAARFHAGLARPTASACATAAAAAGVGTVVLSGGVFQNRLLLERTTALLERAGLRPLVPERLPPNDGGVAYGQAAVAARWLLEGHPVAGGRP